MPSRSLPASSLRCLALLLALAAAASSGEGPETLREADFDARLYSPRLVILFHAPWCRHCQAAVPRFRQLAAQLAARGADAALVDVTTDEPLAVRYNVTRLPTYRAFRYGFSQEYDAGSHGEDVAAWAGAKLGQPLLRFALDAIVKTLPAGYPFQPATTFKFEDLRATWPRGVYFFAATNFAYLAVGAVGVYFLSSPKLFCYMLCHFTSTSLMIDVILAGRPYAGLVQPLDLALALALLGFGTARLLYLLWRQAGSGSLWAALGVSVLALRAFLAGIVARRAGEQEAYMLWHGAWHLLSASVAGIIVWHGCPRASPALRREKTA